MQIPNGSEGFTFPDNRPSSPPATPSSSRSRQPSAPIPAAVPRAQKRNGFILVSYSPPENIEPKGLGHGFSYTPPLRRNASSDSSSSSSDDEDDDVANSAGRASSPQVDTESDAASVRRPSIVRPLDEETDFTVEELSDNDIGYDSETEIVRPDQTEDAPSECGSVKRCKLDHEILEKFRSLNCDTQERAEFEKAQRMKYERKKKKWSIGGKKKRSHAQSIGSDSDDVDDLEPMEAQQVGSSARRLRRRTMGPSDGERPRTSLIFDEPPAEIEEMIYDGNVDLPPLISDDDISPYDEEPGEDEGEKLLPLWLYSQMEVDSDPSRPSSAAGPVRR
ncbi:hypothetical protein EJ06DRAFT_336025 [Trichodelitschia bisporula]|uniref:Uncharacterized protein n=1 Tax=Trichodelitschia bisporula TaxID=703511 RepID=A0A6G1I2F3_9PEZI|nr:hypothetical protein EJ06DRAFT_336025 [Trichodelitschia bisporula]